ncbi:MAG: nucleotidyltransferase domain-containing protein [bacterium]|nr:nucleotidyltransferase domain-containing protein [bacterium]
MAELPSEVLARHRDEVLAAAGRHGIQNVRVFGSVARGEDSAGADVDLLVTIPDSASPWALARFQMEVEEILAVPVDVVEDTGAAPSEVLERARREAVPL